jgi:hypothetical protein
VEDLAAKDPFEVTAEAFSHGPGGDVLLVDENLDPRQPAIGERPR